MAAITSKRWLLFVCFGPLSHRSGLWDHENAIRVKSNACRCQIRIRSQLNAQIVPKSKFEKVTALVASSSSGSGGRR